MLKPPHIVLVHGEQNEMARLKAAIIREYEDDEDVTMEVYNPRNTQAVELYFRGEKMAKVMGSLAVQKPKEGHRISGVLIKRGFNYHLVNPGDLANYTELATSTITERMSVPLAAPLSLLHHHLSNLSPDAIQCLINEKPAIKVFDDVVSVTQDKEENIIVEWTANATNDMLADAVLAVILQVDTSPTMFCKQDDNEVLKKTERFPSLVLQLMYDMFGSKNVQQSDDKMIHVTLDNNTAKLDPFNVSVECDDETLQHQVLTAAKRLHTALS